MLFVLVECEFFLSLYCYLGVIVCCRFAWVCMFQIVVSVVGFEFICKLRLPVGLLGVFVLACYLCRSRCCFGFVDGIYLYLLISTCLW